MENIFRIVKILRLVIRVYPQYILWLIGESIFEILNAGIKIMVPSLFLDFLLRFKNLNERPLYVICFVLILLIANMGTDIYKRRMDDVRNIINFKFEKMLNEKLLDVEYLYMEDPEFLDLKSGASYALSSYKAIQNVLDSITHIISTLILLLISGVYMIVQNIYLIVILVIGVIIETHFANRINGKLQSYFEMLYMTNRKFDWYNGLKKNHTYQKDIRLFRMEKVITRKIEDFNIQTTKMFAKMNDITFENYMEVSFVNTLVIMVCFILCGLKANGNGIEGISRLLLEINMINAMNSSLKGISDYITAVSQMVGYLEPLEKLLKITNHKGWGKEKILDINCLSLQNVSFCYPGNSEKTIKNITFEIKKGEKIAIVGPNGAGKSTLIKIICGLYDISEGTVLVNGQPIRKYEQNSFLKNIAIVEQDYQVFDYTIADNVAMSESKDYEKIEDALKIAGAVEIVKALPRGIETTIGAVENTKGNWLSGGESQKIAIARAVYKDASIYIFDEPTSSLDAIAEFEVYNQYDKITKNKTCIYISHRMATTRFCDKIIVLLDGEIIECGTHKDLLNMENGVYKEMYYQQKCEYTE